MLKTDVGSKQSRKLGGCAARRHQNGSVIEFAVSLPVIVAVVSLALNLTIALLSVRAVDLAARDAARAASLQQTRDAALNAARAALATHAFAGQTPVVEEQSFVFDTAQGQGQPYAGPGPIVVVTVAAQAQLPFKCNFYGTVLGIDGLKVTRTYTFPIMKLPKPRPVPGGPGPIVAG
jgi:Flp pilus assembly protein TadG